MICAATNRRDTADLPPQPEPPSIVSPVDDLARRLLALQRRNEELEAFVRALAHDAGSLTRGIALRTQLLRERLQGKDAELADIVDALDERAARLARMSEGLLRLARIDARELDCRQIDLSGLAHTIAEELRASQPARAVQIRIEPGLSAWGDPALVRLVLENLFGNAWKYTAAAASARIEFGCRAGDCGPVFYIADNGIGFSSEEIERLFMPFARLDSARSYAGTGLGLVIVKHIVERHGGWIRADGAGRGAAFVFSLGTPAPAPRALLSGIA